jgi:hypothetical protein
MPLAIIESSTRPPDFVAHAMKQLAARPHVLNGGEAATLVMDAGQSVARELFGDMRDSIPAAPFDVRGRQRRASPDFVEDGTGGIGDTPVQIALLVTVVRAPRRVLRVFRDTSQRECLAVEERGVASTVQDDDRMLA